MRKPRDKAAVENEVKIAYRRIYAKLRNRRFFSLEQVNAAFAEKTREHNQTRMQQKEYCREASKRSQCLTELFRKFFDKSEVPEIQYRRRDGLMSLQRKTEPTVFERVCRYALDNGIYTYHSIKRIIDTRVYLPSMVADETRESNKHVKHANIRGREYYTV